VQVGPTHREPKSSQDAPRTGVHRGEADKDAQAAFVLVVEDEKSHGEAIVEGLRRSGHVPLLVGSGAEAIASIRRRPPDVVITDYKLGGDMNGMDVLRQTKQISPDTEVILITAHGSEQLAREALRPTNEYRAYDYITKPIDLEEVREVVNRAARQAITSRENRAMREQLDKAFSFEGIVGVSSEMARVIKRLKRVADSKITVLILGESGTGKELVAQAIHNNSPRKNKPFKVINCAGLNENLLESELFGHVKGAYTGAIADRKGLFEAADGGTLFLDEVGDMPMAMQAKLLRALENGEIIPVGSNDVRRVDVRVVAATRRDLREMVNKGEFRDDLYYRLNQVTIRLPPLRERREDIPLLVDHFIREANAKHGKHVKSISAEALRRLSNHRWEGNVRELKSVIDSMVVLADGDRLDVDDLPESVRGSTDIVPAGAMATAGLTMDEMEKIHIANTLRLTGGNREKAAKVLGIGARTLYRKLKEYGLN